MLPLQQVHENILDGNKVIERTRFLRKNSKGQNSAKKNVCGVTVLILCTLSVVVYICNKFHQIP